MAKIKKKPVDKGGKSFIIWMTATGIVLTVSYAAVLAWKSKPSRHLHQRAEVLEVEDPVCKMKVKPPAEGHIEYRAKHYYFCSQTCKDEFEKEPQKYLK